MLIGIVYLFAFMAFMWYMSDRVNYLTCVSIYAVGRGVIPCLFPFVGILTIIVNFVVRFVIGLLFVKLLIKFTYSLDDYRVIVPILAIIEFIITLVLSMIIAGMIMSIV